MRDGCTVVYARLVYQLRAPAPALARFVEHYWFVTPDGAEPVDLRVDVFVDARADLIFNFDAPYRREVIGGRATSHRRSNLDAQRTVPIRIVQRGRVRITGVRFRLGGLGAFTGPAGDLARFTNLTPAPSAVFGAPVRALEKALSVERDLDAQARALDAFFVERLGATEPRRSFERALAALEQSRGGLSVEAMAKRCATTPRQIERSFRRELGIAPKTVGRILRFQSALKMLMRDPGGTLADVAAACGYYDQAHFVREFRKMSGGVPRGYRGYYPPAAPTDFAPNVVVFVQDDAKRKTRS